MRSRLLLVALLAGCTPDFADPTTVTDLRLLAVVADPPEIVVDLPAFTLDGVTRPEDLAALLAGAGAALPATFPPITLRALVLDPHGGGRSVHLVAVTCGNVATGSGLVRGPGLVMAPGRIRDTIDRDPCPADSPVLATEDVRPPAETVGGAVPFAVNLVVTREELSLDLAGDPLGLVYGMPITVQITASADGDAGHEEVVARKRVVFVPRLLPQQTPNRNPVVTGLTLRPSEDDPGVRLNLDDPLAQPPSVPLGAKVWLEPDRGETELYPTMVSDRRTGALTLTFATEALRYAFFATAGTFTPATTNTDPPVLRTPPRRPLAVRYQAPVALPADGSDLVHVWVVNRDERGGSSFVRVALRLTSP
jgi:hypothetical protein